MVGGNKTRIGTARRGFDPSACTTAKVLAMVVAVAVSASESTLLWG